MLGLLVELRGQEERPAFSDILANPHTLVVELNAYCGTTFQIDGVCFSPKWTCNVLRLTHTDLFIWISRWLWE